MWKFTFYRDAAGEYRWRLKAANGEIVGQGEGHTRLADAVRSAESFKANVGQARVVRPVRRRRAAQPPSVLDTLLSEFAKR